MKKYVIRCNDGEYNHYTKSFNTKEEAKKVAQFIYEIFAPTLGDSIIHEFETIEVEEVETGLQFPL